MDEEFTAPAIARFLILDGRMPRSLRFCAGKLVDNLGYLGMDDTEPKDSLVLAKRLYERLRDRDIAAIFDEGLHEFLTSVIDENARIGMQIEQDYRFNS